MDRSIHSETKGDKGNIGRSRETKEDRGRHKETKGKIWKERETEGDNVDR